MGYKVAVVGATGAVGREMLQTIENLVCLSFCLLCNKMLVKQGF